MKRLLVVFIPLVVFLIGCGEGGAKKRANDSTFNSGSAVVGSGVPDSNCSISVVSDMLQWYKTNHARLDSIQLVNNLGGKDTGRYKMQFDYVKKYIAIVRSSGLFTEGFSHEPMGIAIRNFPADRPGEKWQPPSPAAATYRRCGNSTGTSAAENPARSFLGLQLFTIRFVYWEEHQPHRLERNVMGTRNGDYKDAFLFKKYQTN
jgi:hypothetical protein